jgi:hypothetical protein
VKVDGKGVIFFIDSVLKVVCSHPGTLHVIEHILVDVIIHQNLVDFDEHLVQTEHFCSVIAIQIIDELLNAIDVEVFEGISIDVHW